MGNTKKPDLDPKTLLQAAVTVERELSIFTGPELIARWSKGDAATVFEHIAGKPVIEMALDHNPFWHYLLQTWYKPPRYRRLLHPPRHRDEFASAILRMSLGELDRYDGVHIQYPRRGLKSFLTKAAADWLPKRHKIVDDLDILVMYSHNLETRAKGALETIKNINRHNKYIQRHFGQGCLTLTGNPANFTIPMTEWGEKNQWDWPCRDPEYLAGEKNMTAEAASSRKAGSGFNYRLLDDWEAEDSRKSEAVREDMQDKYDQQRQLAAPPWSRELSVGTPYHIQSLYKPFSDPANKHEDGTPRYFVIRTPALTDDNKPNFPTIPRLSVENLAKERANEMRRRGTDRFWYLQYMLDPTLTGEQALQWEHFIPLTPEEFKKRFGNLPKFRAVYCDPAWKGDDNHQEGADAAIGCVDTYSIAGQVDCVLLDLTVSNEMESDEGADEMLRMMRVWHTSFYSVEQQADKPMVGIMKRIWKSTPYEVRPPQMPRFIDAKAWNKRAKNDRISTVAGHAKTGHWYYLTTINPVALNVLKTTVTEYPASVKRDTLDMMAQANAEEVLARWVPIAIPEPMPQIEEMPIAYATRYTGLPALFH